MHSSLSSPGTFRGLPQPLRRLIPRHWSNSASLRVQLALLWAPSASPANHGVLMMMIARPHRIYSNEMRLGLAGLV